MAEQCTNCGAELFTAQRFCRACGTPPVRGENEDAPTQMMSPPEGWSPRGTTDTAPTMQPETTPVYAPPSYYTPSIPPPAPTVPHLPPQPYALPAEPPRSRSPWIIAVVLMAILMFGGAIYGGRILINKIRAAISDMQGTEIVDQLDPIALNKGAAVLITGLNGNVTIEGWNQPHADVRVIKRGKSEELLRDISPKVTNNPDSFVIDTTEFMDNVSMSLRIRLPRDIGSVNIRTTNGTINIKDVSGLIEVESLNGSIGLEDVSGVARAQTINGSINAEINSIAENQPVSFTTTNGSITLNIQAPINANLEASTTTGSLRIDNDFGISVQRTRPGARASGQIGAGGPKLTVTTISGSIRIRK